MTGKRKRGTAYNPTKANKRKKRGESAPAGFAKCLDVNTRLRSQLHARLRYACPDAVLTPPLASVPVSSPHPHGAIDENEYYNIRTVLAERVVRRGIECLVDWEDDVRTGEKFAPTWEPKENLTDAALADWEASKLAGQAGVSKSSALNPKASSRRLWASPHKSSLIVVLRLTNRKAELPTSSSSTKKLNATPLRNPAPRGKVRRVPSSSSIGQSTPVTSEDLVTAATDISRSIEIRESPEASSAGALVNYTSEDSSLFVPQDIDPEIPSQDLAFVQPSEPHPSYQNYVTLGSSQIDSATDPSKPSQNLPHSQGTLTTDPAVTTELVLATSQNVPSSAPTPGQHSTGRVVPDSQSLPTSPNFLSQPQVGNSEEAAASQIIGDLQSAAEAPATKSQEPDNRISSQFSLPQSANRSLANQLGHTTDLPQTPNEIAARSPSVDAPSLLSRGTKESLKEAQETLASSSPVSVAGSDIHAVAPDSPSQIDYRESIEDQASQVAVTTVQHPLSESVAIETSFPFETQIAQPLTQASTRTPARPLVSPHSQPLSEHSQPPKALDIFLRGNSLPVQNESLSSPFPAVPSQTLPTIGESAPSLPHTPSSQTRTPVRNSATMDRRTPTSEPKMGMAAKIKAMKAEQAAKRGQTPSKSATPSQITPVKPSAVPPRINAELAAETPTHAGSSESFHNGGRSPSAVPAVLPVQAVTQDEMNTSGRYKTLVPQEKENLLLRRQSTITGTASKEASKGGNYVHSVPIALTGHQRDSYPLMIQHHKDIIERFLQTIVPSDELMVEIETLLERLRRIVVHPDLDNIETYTQYDVPPSAHAKWAIDCSSKFHFLKHLIDELRDKELAIAVICQSAQLLHILENFLLGFKVTCYRADTGQLTEQDGCALTIKIMSSNEDASHESLAADAVICMDNSAEAGGSTLKLLQEPKSDLVMMTLAVPGTIEHVERCLSSNLTHQQKLRALVHGIFDLRHDSGKLEHGQLPSVETAKVIAGLFNSSPADREWSIPALSMLENLDSQTESDIELPQSGEAAYSGVKHTLDTSEVEMPTSDTFKRPRLASNGVHPDDQLITINPLELDITHISDSAPLPSHVPLVSSGVLDPSDVNETVKRLQSLLLTAQSSLADHRHDLGELQYRHEEQRNQIIELTRKNEDAIEMAQKAVTRMTEGSSTANAMRIENRSLKEQLKAAQEALADHSIPERAELEQVRLAFQQSQNENQILEKRLKTQQSDIDYAQEMYQNSSSAAQRLGTTNRELENALSHASNRASGEQTRAKQMTLNARAQNLARENKQLKAKFNEQTDALTRKDKELSLLKEASRGRMGTRGSSVPRSPRMGSPLKNAAGSRQSSPSAGELRGRTHPLRQG
jgi:hypothetical protein